jgi:hypothetical protein
LIPNIHNPAHSQGFINIAENPKGQNGDKRRILQAREVNEKGGARCAARPAGAESNRSCNSRLTRFFEPHLFRPAGGSHHPLRTMTAVFLSHKKGAVSRNRVPATIFIIPYYLLTYNQDHKGPT